MQEIYAVVQKGRMASGTWGVTNVMKLFGRVSNLPWQKRLRVVSDWYNVCTKSEVAVVRSPNQPKLVFQKDTMPLILSILHIRG